MRICWIIFICLGSLVTPSFAESISWSDQQKAVLSSLSLSNLGPPPVPHSNKYAADPEAIALGQQLFFDKRLSASGDFSCASCHQTERYFTDGLAQSKAAGTTLRNAPTVIGVAYQDWFYWDGRRDSLWSQALTPIEATDEMASSRVAVVHLLQNDKNYRDSYDAIFSFPLPALENIPLDANPYGTKEQRQAWEKIDDDKKKSINHVFANVGKAIAAYERTLVPESTRVDAYIDALLADNKRADQLLTAEEEKGLELFIDSKRTQCLNCHNGPLLSNGEFQNIGTGNFEEGLLDFGREFGLRAVWFDEFNCIGNYSDADKKECSALRFMQKDGHFMGAYKVPGLRGLKWTAPYFHDGTKNDLTSVLRHYQLSTTFELTDELQPVTLTAEEEQALIALLLAFSE